MHTSLTDEHSHAQVYLDWFEREAGRVIEPFVTTDLNPFQYLAAIHSSALARSDSVTHARAANPLAPLNCRFNDDRSVILQ